MERSLQGQPDNNTSPDDADLTGKFSVQFYNYPFQVASQSGFGTNIGLIFFGGKRLINFKPVDDIQRVRCELVRRVPRVHQGGDGGDVGGGGGGEGLGRLEEGQRAERGELGRREVRLLRMLPKKK